jgi:hypothetical protein
MSEPQMREIWQELSKILSDLQTEGAAKKQQAKLENGHVS